MYKNYAISSTAAAPFCHPRHCNNCLKAAERAANIILLMILTTKVHSVAQLGIVIRMQRTTAIQIAVHTIHHQIFLASRQQQ
jgi:hypothetical protein